MTTLPEGQESGDPGPVPGLLSYLPPAWVAVTVLMSARALAYGWQAMSDYELPAGVRGFIQTGMAASTVTVAWGLWVLSLAWKRSARFPVHFTAWQVALILWTIATQVYLATSGDFLLAAGSFIYPVAEIAIGLLCIRLVRVGPAPSPVAAAHGGPAGDPVAPGRSPAAALGAGALGLLAGALLGAFSGFLLGGVAAQLTDMSCFEGACGYFAAMTGLLGLMAGAAGGLILALRWVRRRARPPL